MEDINTISAEIAVLKKYFKQGLKTCLKIEGKLADVSTSASKKNKATPKDYFNYGKAMRAKKYELIRNQQK